ncbi:hypothetical protein PUR61_22105 [Streptomyces sp. BE20]|uniref:hypothetical protein n=1 Tax=unclassified Streptomyces TaxID=2593676 RepID=UPI002E787614|nr:MULTISPECIES: hypothetical protein [unclassified Streptomyces]MED7951018.1 hypothetical protein [Streptomyces sp. BE303]MEE1824853.1 hypothetical protein [Streptomyces sp. BE20]
MSNAETTRSDTKATAVKESGSGVVLALPGHPSAVRSVLGWPGWTGAWPSSARPLG